MKQVALRTLQTKTQDSTANTAQTLTIAAIQNQKHIITAVEVSVSGAAVGASGITITLKDGTTTKWKTAVAASSVVGTQKIRDFFGGVEMSTNTAVNLEIAAGGTGVVTTGNIAYYTE